MAATKGLTPKQKTQIQTLIKSGKKTFAQIAEQFGVTKYTVSYYAKKFKAAAAATTATAA